jgi:hypothetical protein
MKSLFSKVGLRLVVFQLGLLLCQTASAAVGFTVTPSSVSNTYIGPVTLQVTGLTNGETVVVQKYLDLNADHVVDAGDLLAQQFNLTDGQPGMVIGGVTNINVPGDTDAVKGQITAVLNFQNGDFTQNIIGQYLYVVHSVSGAVTNLFTVTNAAYAQSFTGSVVNNGTNVPDSIVLLFPPPTSGHGLGQPVAGVVANNSGNFTLQAPAGSYSFLAARSNFLYNFSTTPVLTLSNGATAAKLTLTNATTSISGSFVDATNSSIVLPGVFVANKSSAGLIGIGVTGSNGDFTIGVTSGQWEVSGSSGLIVHGYAELENNPTFEAGATNATVAYTRATALFYGSVKDNLGNPLPGIPIGADDNNFEDYDSDGYADAGGNYVTVAVGGLGNGDLWQLGVDNSSSFPNYNFSQPSIDQNGGANIAVGESMMVNFTAIRATNTITGNVKFSGSPVANVQVTATSQDAYNYRAQAYTDTNGNYSLTVGNDFWNVSVSCQGGDNGLDSILGSGNYQCPSSESVTIDNDNGTADFTVLPPGGSVQIFGYVVNSAGTAIVGVSVSANDGNGDNYSTTTDSSGYYSFSVGNGTWIVSVDCSGLSSLGYQCVGSENVNVSGNSVEQDFTAQSSGTNGGPLQITTISLPDDLVSNSYNQQLSASGGQPPYSWSLTPGSLPLPEGINLSTNGDISGTPDTADIGTNYFSVRVTDSLANTVDQLLSVTIYPALTIGTNALPNGAIGTPYSAEILVSGGDADSGYSYNVVGTLPPGLNAGFGTTTTSNELFVISGTPTNSGTFSFTFEAYDLDFDEVQEDFSITIANSTLQITTASLPNATVGAEYTNQLQVSGGTPPYNWTIATGSQQPPSALTLSTNGLLSGVPAASGTNSFIVRVTDSDSVSVTRTLTLTTIPNLKPSLGSGEKAGGQFQFLVLNAAIGQNYTVQTSTNLGSTNWTSLFITNNAATNSFPVIDPNASNSQGFYRILVGP